MTRIIQGVFRFQHQVFGAKRGLFEQLRGGQRPLALFITCADSRINPNLLTQTEPGELFVLRNAGNLVPPLGTPVGGESASIEYAISHLHVRDVILCGHSLCGAMQGLIAEQPNTALPAVAQWLKIAEPCVAAARARVSAGSPAALLEAVIEQNVLLQIEHLKTYPVVRDAAAEGRLRLHAWVYHFERGEVAAYDAAQDRFVPLRHSPRAKFLVPTNRCSAPLDTHF
ncbi:MAG TPA: carbonic anhydrase [Pirellulales bacterium]|jgi:carbonic anhydrase|nr:carbonic anhydrase [Pirellulales bacterium]